MRSSRINYVLVGSFAIAMAVALLVCVAVLSGRTGPRDRYFAGFDNVTGVVPGTQVLFEGYPVGQVERCELAPQPAAKRFRVEMSVRRGWPIPEDSVARIVEPGLLAAITIDIKAGESREPLAPGGELRGAESANVLAVVSSMAGEMEALVEENADALLAIVSNLESFSAGLDAVMGPGNRESLARMLADAERTAANLARVSEELGHTREELDRLLASSNEIVLEGGQDLRHILGSVAAHIDSVARNLEGTSRNMHEFSRYIRQNPSALVRGGGASPASLDDGR